MELEVMKKLIKRQQRMHRKLVRESLRAERYYRKKNDILSRGTKAPGHDNPMHSADNRIPSNFYNILVNQKASYLFTSPPIFDTGVKELNVAVSKILGDDFAKVCKNLCINASNCVTAWLHYWINERGEFKYAVVDSKQCIPVWTNDLEKELSGFLRMYDQTNDDGKVYNIYEYWDVNTCWSYCKENGAPIDTLQFYNSYELRTYELTNTFDDSVAYAHNFGEIPFIPFFNNAECGNDLDDIKELIDTYDKVYSGYLNDIEDIQEIIFILSGYEGESLSEFLQKLKKYKTIKVDGNEDGKGGLSTLTIDIPVEAREKMLAMTRKAIFEQGMGIDPDPQNFGNSSGVALSYLYSLLELKAGLMETEFRSGFSRLVKAICHYLGGKFDNVRQIWERTSVRNDAELATIASQSTGVISKRTIVANHPWVDDVEEELQQIKQEEEDETAAAELYNPFKKNTNEGIINDENEMKESSET